MTRPIYTALICIIYSTVWAQKAPFKFGKLTKEEFAVESCSFSPDATSMILANYGNLSFRYNDDKKRWNYAIEVIERRKIFSKTDKDAGNIKIQVYSPKDGRLEEKISRLKAYTYNEVDGKLEKIKLEKDAIFENRINDFWSELSFVFPNVQEGSVLEYTYWITSDFINNLRTWNFQNDVPTAYSEFNYKIPEYFDYQISQEGTYLVLKSEEKKANESFVYSWETTPQSGGKVERGQSQLNSMSIQRQLIAKNVKELLNEPFMNNRVNQPSRVEFQLRSYEMPGQIRQYIAGDYQKFTQELLQRTYFGNRLKESGFAKQILSELVSLSDQEKIIELYSWFQSHYTWNGVYTFTSGDGNKKVYNDKTGSVAAINLSFIAAAKKAGFDVEPIILSTRGNGIPNSNYPSYDRFNYVVCLLTLGEKQYFLDPSSSLPFGQLPLRCRNGNGWLVASSKGRWINLKSNSTYDSRILISTKIVNNAFISDLECKESGYLAINSLSKYQKQGEENYFEQKEEYNKDWNLNTFNVEEMIWGKPVKYSYQLTKGFDTEDVIYLSPLISGVETENPFTREERMSNVDIPYQIKKMTISKIEIPKDYEAEIPEAVSYKLPDNMGSFTYRATQVENQIQITSSFRLLSTDFTTKQYPLLKQFYELMVAKNKEIVVLKKM